MSDFAALESRLAAALERIRSGVEGLGSASLMDQGAEEIAALANQLDEERMTNAQLQERVRVLTDRHDQASEPLQGQVDAQARQMSELDAELQRLRAVNTDLRELSAQLRSAATDGVAQPELINSALMAEVEALQAQRSADRAELAAILADLKPIVEEA